MENITLGEIGVAIAFLAALITGLGVLIKRLKGWIKDVLKEQLDEIRAENEELKKHIDNVDLNTCKNFLVARISEIERGDGLGEVESERFWEQYQHYLEKGGNSYIRHKVEQLKEDGKL